MELKALLESLPQIETKQLDVVGCAHEVAYADDYDQSDLELKPRSGPPAREYKFTLDPFQERSVMSFSKMSFPRQLNFTNNQSSCST